MTQSSVATLDEAHTLSVDDLRADIIRSAAAGQGPTFIATKLDLLMAGVRRIHAGKSREWLDDGDEARYPNMPFGAIVAVATLADCVPVGRLPPELQANEHANGPWCWILTDVRRLHEPLPMRGAQGLWDVQLAVPSSGATP